jgi:hypothetical protein
MLMPSFSNPPLDNSINEELPGEKKQKKIKKKRFSEVETAVLNTKDDEPDDHLAELSLFEDE